jgi:Mor family transcriptional regulator
MSYKVADLPDDCLPGLDELNGDLRMLAEKVGVRKALEISELFGGTTACFFGHRRHLNRWRDKQIRAEYDAGGISVTELARKYNLSERHVYTILGQQPGEDKQLKLF